MIIMISASHCLLTFIVSITASWIAITNAQQIQQYQQQEWSFFKRKTDINSTYFHAFIFILS